MLSWADQTSDIQKGWDWDYTEDEPLHETCVSRGFQQCGQQYVDGYCHAQNTTPFNSSPRQLSWIAGFCLSVGTSLYRAMFIVVPFCWWCSSAGLCVSPKKLYKQTNSVALSLQANYTKWATATCRWNLVPTFVDRGVSRGQRGRSPMVVSLSFLDRSRYFSFK
jgi:hypothetical protein